MIRNLFILLTFLSIGACSFNRMFLVPYKIQEKTVKKKFVDDFSGDTLMLSTDSLFNPSIKSIHSTKPSYTYQIRNVFFNNSAGKQLQGWIFKARKSNGISLFFTHGNGGNILYHFSIILPLVQKGYNVFIFDYSGFGLSEGKATRKNVLSSGQAAFDYFLQQEECKGNKVMIYGQSLGGHLAVCLAQRNESKIDGLIAEGAFSNHDDVGAYVSHLGFFAKMMIREYYDGIKSIKKYTKPTLIIHSVNDKVVPYKFGKKLYDNSISIQKEFYSIDSAHILGPIYFTDSIDAKIRRMVK